LQLLDMFSLKKNISEEQMKSEIDRVSSIYEKMYDTELGRLSSGQNKWFSKIDGTRKIKVNNTLLEQLKQFQFNG